ncbi:MAG: F-box protein [Simkaniaceae bacterium]|nr:F-box protein [Simkaniaceae bacterium]
MMVSSLTARAGAGEPPSEEATNWPGEENTLATTFRFLAPEDLGKVGKTCRQWHRISRTEAIWEAFDLNTLSTNLLIKDKKWWETHFEPTVLETAGLVIDESLFPVKRVQIMTVIQLLKSLKVEKPGDVPLPGGQLTLLTLPEGLTLRKVTALPGARFAHMWPAILEEQGDIPLPTTTLVAITNHILSGSRNLMSFQQKQLLQEQGCEMPSVLAVATLAILTQKDSGIMLYPGLTSTRCKERIEAGCPDHLTEISAGRFNLVGFHIDSTSCGWHVGVAALKQLHGH